MPWGDKGGGECEPVRAQKGGGWGVGSDSVSLHVTGSVFPGLCLGVCYPWKNLFLQCLQDPRKLEHQKMQKLKSVMNICLITLVNSVPLLSKLYRN
jgi:hypothetical protein